MSTDFSKPHAPSKLPRDRRAGIIMQTIAIGLLLYLVPPVLASFLIVLGATLGGITLTEVNSWLTHTAFAQFVYVLLAEMMVLASLVWLLRLLKESWRSIGVRRPEWRHIPYIIGGFFSYYAIYIVAAMIISQFIPLNFDQRQEIGFSTEAAGSSMVFAFAALVVVPPIVEEILFRGFLYTRFKQVLSVKWAAVAVSILFASAHLQFGSGNALLWVAALDTFILSLVLVYIREKTGTIWAGAGVHALKNLVAFLILFNVVQ